jgi:lysophospholipase L1-like esterase
MAIGIGIGLQFSKLVNGINSIINAFKTRVAADSGTFEAESCLNTTLTTLNNLGLYDKASLILTPNAYKVSKQYSIKPSLESQFLTMGDSLTANGGYQNRIVYNLGPEIWGFINKGISGNNTTQMLARFSTDILANAISGEYCVIFGGINDLAQDVPNSTIQSNLQLMYDEAKAAGLIIIAVTTSPWKGSAYWTSGRQSNQDLLNDWILNTASNCDYKVDIYPILEDPSTPDTLLPTYDSGDHIHYSTAGYNSVGDTMCSVIGFQKTTQVISDAGDFTISRSSVASRRNSSGKWETVDINIPRLNYPIGGGCPKWLMEQQSTSEVGYSMWTGGGATPTGWSTFGSGTSAVGATTNFFEVAEGVITYQFTAVSNYIFFYKSKSVISGSTYTWSIFIEAYNNITYGDILFITGAGFSSFTYKFNGVVVTSGTQVSGTGRLELVAICNTTGSAIIRVGAGTQGSNITGSCILSLPQFELGDCATSPIITSSGSTTRTSDIQNTTLKPMIGQTEGTLFVEFSQPILKGNDVVMLNRSLTNSVAICTDNSGNIVVYIYYNSSSISYNTSIKVTPNGLFKVALGYKSGDNYISINGVGYAFSDSYTFNGDLASINTFKAPFLFGALPTNYGPIITYLTRLTNSELNSLTA